MVKVTVNRDDCPGIVVLNFQEALAKMGISVTDLNPGAEDSGDWEIVDDRPRKDMPQTPQDFGKESFDEPWNLFIYDHWLERDRNFKMFENVIIRTGDDKIIYAESQTISRLRETVDVDDQEKHNPYVAHIRHGHLSQPRYNFCPMGIGITSIHMDGNAENIKHVYWLLTKLTKEEIDRYHKEM